MDGPIQSNDGYLSATTLNQRDITPTIHLTIIIIIVADNDIVSCLLIC